MRNVTKALTVVSLLAPVSGYSLGIGDIKVRSALNQNLNAEITLVASRGENPSNIKVSLAPAEKFDEAGVPWTYFLSKLKFQPIVKSNGTMVIKVTSREALKEPYLNFLIEVSWPKGNLYREFTVLVDPPAEYQHETFQEPAYPEPVYHSPSPYDAMPMPVERQEYVPRRSSRPARATRSRAVKSRRIAAGNYGGQIVTRRNDTLWNVAARARGGGVSVEQMMVALYNQNPQAFFQQNVNALSAGRALKVPDKGAVEQMSRQDALAEFARHNEAWNTNRSGIPRNETQVAQQNTPDNQLKLEAPAEATVAANETVAPSSEQAAGGNKGAVAPGQPTTKQGSTDSSGNVAVDKALQDKINALEKQMANMEQIIALKDKQLAGLQNSGKTTPPVTETLPPIQQVTPPPPPVQPPVGSTQPPITQPPVAQQPAKGTPEQTKAVPPVVPPKPVVKPRVTTTVAPPPSPVDEGLPLPLILGGVGAGLLSLFGWLWWRKQKVLKETDAESMFKNYSSMRNSEMVGGSQSSVMRRSSAAASRANGESSFLNDFKASDFESFESFNVDHSDIDPVAEADVYLAYGRYQQAEDLMRDAIKDHPERDDCKLKLLEVYQASSNKDKFEAYAKELGQAGKRNEVQFWSKVVLLARDISTDSELFSHPLQSNVAVFPTEADTITENVLFQASPIQEVKNLHGEQNESAKIVLEDEHSGAATFEVDDSEGTGSVFEDLPAAPDLLQEDTVSSPAPDDLLDILGDESKLEGLQDNESLDFDLGPYPRKEGMQGAEPKAPPRVEPEKLGEKNDLEVYEFDFEQDLISEDKPAKPQSDSAQATDTWDSSQTLDFSLDEPLESSTEDNDTIDFDLNAPDDKASKPNNSYPVSDLTDMDEMETKLDLAKAYVDMGDADSAKDIILQVIEHGTAEQKKAAQLLLDDL